MDRFPDSWSGGVAAAKNSAPSHGECRSGNVLNPYHLPLRGQCRPCTHQHLERTGFPFHRASEKSHGTHIEWLHVTTSRQ